MNWRVIFFIGLLLRVFFLFTPGSYYLNDLFIPFLDKSILNLNQNPWLLSPPHFFPYGTVLFALLFIPKYLFFILFGENSLGLTPLSIFSIKGVLLVFDLLFLKELLKLLPQQPKKILIFYWLNPVLIYISYIHGQLDIVPTFFIFMAILTLSQEKTKISSFFSALSVLTKFHTIIVLPFFLAYIWNREFTKQGIQKLLTWFTIFTGIFSIGYLPVLKASRFDYLTIGSPEALRVFSLNLDLGLQHKLFVGFGIFTIMLVRLCLVSRITKISLLYGSGFLFGTLLLVVDAMPGWYFWVYPFIALFYSTHPLASRTLFWSSVVLYLTYFVFLPKLPIAQGGLISGAVYTLLQGTFLGILYTIWIYLLKREVLFDRRTKPLLIGIAGNSGVGKNTLTSLLKDLFGSDITSAIEGDDYHKWERGHIRWADYTHLNPKANHLHSLASHTRELLSGRWILYQHYDHSKGEFTFPREIQAKRTLVIQGLHTFYLKTFREKFNITIFISPDEKLRMAWKILRDAKERGHSIEKVLKSIESRKNDSAVFIEPQKQHADWVIEYKPIEDFDIKTILENSSPPFYVNHILWNDTPLDFLLDQLTKVQTLQCHINLIPGNMDKISFTVVGSITTQEIENIAYKSFECLRHLTRGHFVPKWHSGFDGITQLVMLANLERYIEISGTVK